MTHQNHQTNGASLEDCHTNFFALTELCGIKWRKLVWGEGGGNSGNPLEDPVISSYARCLAGDILCVWRRVSASPPPASDPYDEAVPPPPPPPPPLSLRAAKELWIFWYGDEPNLTGLVAPELITSQSEQGSWEGGLSYECRSLLFKALHNLIERCLLSRDFIRLGKWFVQPYDGDDEDPGKNAWHLSFSFAFFVHGESTVCASVDVRQHPPVRTLTPARLARLRQNSHAPHPKVILAPFGLEARVVGGCGGARAARLLDSWRALYPLGASGAVEVLAGGVRLAYPAAYTLLTDLDAAPTSNSPPQNAARHLAERAQQIITQHVEIDGQEKIVEYADPWRATSCNCASRGISGCSPASCASPAPQSAPSPPAAPAPPDPHPPPTPHHHQSCAGPGSESVPAALSTPAPTPDPPAKHQLYQTSLESPLENAAAWSRPPAIPPAPPKQSSRDLDSTLHSLYDYQSMHAWLEHPVKRFKTEEGFKEECSPPPDDLYHDHHHHLKPPHKNAQDDSKDLKSSLFTSDGLCPSIKDLDQIFENSDDASGDETIISTNCTVGVTTSAVATRGIWGEEPRRPEELSQMFPTPPSMEANAQPSPHHEEHEPLEEHIEDWSYVFKPPAICKYVGSTTYAPLTTLPSSSLLPLSLPPQAVYRPRWERAPQRRAPPRPAPNSRCSGGTASAPASVSEAASPAPASASSEPTDAPHACALLLNVLLADTVLNIFRDHNFDSCTLCVCNASPKVVGNIRGADSAIYLNGGVPPGSPGDSPSASPPPPLYDEDPMRCSCGFSAVVNRRLAHRAGLFYEDEMEITGLAEEPSGRDPGAVASVAGALLEQARVSAGTCSALHVAARRAAAAARPRDDLRLNLLEYSDGGDAAALALRAAAHGAGGVAGAVHRWPFIGARGPRSSRDVVRLMRRLRPLLQDAIQKRCCGARMWDGVTGPLTWRQFHRLAGRGTEDLCEPQPVPPLLVGHERDWLALSPHAIRHWERLALEPYGYPRDVAYIVLAASGEADDALRGWAKELSATYEACRLGRHAPLYRVAQDGLLKTNLPNSVPAEDEWAGPLPPGRAGRVIRGYADALRQILAPALASMPADRSMFEPDRPSPLRPPETPEHPPTPNSQSDQESEGGNPVNNTSNSSSSNGNSHSNSSSGGINSGGSGWWETTGHEESDAPALFIYVVEPAAAPPTALRAALRLANALKRHLPEQHAANLTVQIISTKGVRQVWWGAAGGSLRALALSVYAQARRSLTHNNHIKSLTGFGTAAHHALLLHNKDEIERAPYRLWGPAWTLAPARPAAHDDLGAAPTDAVLYVAYCLSHDQSWLLAAASDARGELLETTAINVHVPNGVRRRKSPPARRLGLNKLMDFILGVMSQTAQPWRLVVGRIGRMGHGELKGWSWLLSRRALTRASGNLRKRCGACGAGAAPAVLSAALVSTEPDSCLRLMPDRFTPDERFSVASQLHTPRDVSATHILVFPTSATTQSSQSAFQDRVNGPELGDDELFPLGNEDMGEDMELGNMEIFGSDIFSAANWGSPGNSPKREELPGPPRPHSAASSNNDEAGVLLSQQPLALGYLVSTAPLPAMPAWWWASCAHMADTCPAFLKSALHLHAPAVQSNTDDMLLAAPRPSANHKHHPLDSQYTTDVLRYVLEGYNALSWLRLEPSTHDRTSCLPHHVQALVQLYHTIAALS